jgi:hypothetical protein
VKKHTISFLKTTGQFVTWFGEPKQFFASRGKTKEKADAKWYLG